MDISPRLKQILLVLLEQDQIISVKQLAEKIEISKRTVQRELEYVNYILKKYGLILHSKTGKGIWLEGEEENWKALEKELKETCQLDMNDKNQRRRQLIFEILKDKEPQKLFYYANLFGVSEATISKDMEAIEEWFSWMDLTIIRKQGYGVSLEGSEKGYRLALRRFMDENVHRDIWRDILNGGSHSVLEKEGQHKKDYYDLMDLSIFDKVVECMRSLYKTKISRMEESSYLGLAMHLTIAVERLYKGNFLEEEEIESDWEESEEWKLALDLSERINRLFQIQIPEEEVYYICLHIKGARLQYVENEKNTLQENQEEIEQLASEIINAFGGGMDYELKQDEELFNGLSEDLKAMIVRMENNMTTYNPLLKQIKESYPMVFRHTKKAVSVLEKRLGIPVPEGEVAYLAMHFSAAILRMEGRKENLRKVRIGVICASGIGISKLMESKLEQRFHDRVELESYSFEDINTLIEGQIDFFVSSFNMEHTALKTEVIIVSPLLSEEDMKKIEEKIFQYAVLPVKKEKADKEFVRQLEKVSLMVSQIKSILASCKCMCVEKHIEFEELVQVMAKKAAICPDYEYYIQRDVLKREKIATQIFGEMGFALLHARTNGVLEPTILFCVTKDKTPFENPYMQGIKAVIMMLMPKDKNVKQNGQILGCISSSLIDDEKFLETIFSGEQEQIKHYLTKLLKVYFNQYLDTV